LTYRDTFATFEVVSALKVKVFETILNVLDEVTLQTKYVPFAVQPGAFTCKFEVASVMGVPGRIPCAFDVKTWMFEPPSVVRLENWRFMFPLL